MSKDTGMVKGKGTALLHLQDLKAEGGRRKAR
jgi:hypothetical protein